MGLQPLSRTSTRVARAVALAAFFASGGALCGASLVVPSWSSVDRPVLLVVSVSAALVAGVLGLVRARVGAWHCHVLVALGSVMVAVAVHAGGGGAASASFSAFYVWVAVYAFVFFRPLAAVGHVALAVSLETAVLLVLDGGPGTPAQVLINAGTVLATGSVVGVLTARVRLLAGTDALTGLANRRTLEGELAAALSRAARTGMPLALVTLDLDRFKQLNDAHGHAAGDELLSGAARAWTAELRKGDLLARVGGDEFVAVLPDCTQERAVEVARRLVAVVPPPQTACAGTAAAVPSEPGEALLSRADRALYLGKTEGAGSVRSA